MIETLRPTIAVMEKIHPYGIQELEKYAEVIDLTEVSLENIDNELSNVSAIIVKSVTDVSPAILSKAKELKIVARAGTGMENIDVKGLEKEGIVVFNIPSGNSISAAEFTICLILMLSKKIPQALTSVAQNDFRRHILEGREISKLTIGLLGLGRVGLAVAERLAPFGCTLIGWDRNEAQSHSFEKLGGRRTNNLTEIYENSDILSLHLPHTEDTDQIIDEKALSKMKTGACIVNTSRGGCINDEALLKALDTGAISWAAVDVMYPEPPYTNHPSMTSYTHPFLDHPRILVTPHMAASTEDAQADIALSVAQKLKEHLL